MHRREFLAGLIAAATTPAIAAVAQEPDEFADLWARRVLGIEKERTALSTVTPAAQPFDEAQFEEEVRKRAKMPRYRRRVPRRYRRRIARR